MTIAFGKIPPGSGIWTNHFDVTDGDIDWFGLIASSGSIPQAAIIGDTIRQRGGLSDHLTVGPSCPGAVTTGTISVNAIVQNAGPDPSTVSGTISDNGTSYAVSLHRTDGAAIDPTQTTWIIIHGWDSSPSAFSDLVNAIHSQRPGDQILTLDWSAAANTGIFDPGDAEARVPLVAAWAAGALSGLGFSGSNINEIGHSFGAYIAEEIAERVSGGVNTIVALDPAVDVATRGYHPDAPGEVNFAAVSQFSWAFHDSDSSSINLSTLDGFGSAITPQTADEALDVANSNHSEIATLFTYFVSHPNDPVGQDFTLARLLNHTAGPWLPNQYDSNGASSAGSGFEGVITAANGGVTPQSIAYVPGSMPEIAVSGGGINIADGDTTPSSTDLTDFGTILQGGPAARHTFTVTNTGSGTLTTSALTLPAGFSLVEGLSASIAAGGSDTFTVQLDTTSAGFHSGQISFVDNDSDENPFNFSVTGFVSALAVTIESHGATSLVAGGDNYFFYANGTSSGPELRYGGAAWTYGEWGNWAPIGVEATATGYEVAFQLGTANAYTVWNTDANGNITTDSIGTVTASSPTLEALEASFQQDLNNDGVIGLPSSSTLIEAFGSTSLLQTGSNFFFDKGGSGPELHYDGAAFTAGQWGGWTPIGVEAIATGYEVTFKLAGADQYTVWDTESAGNITIDPTGTVTGTSTTLIGLERSFQQDLNGDGMIGNPAIAIAVESFGLTSLVLTGNDYFLDANGTSSGPALKYGGTPWTDGEWGGWTPTGAEVTATGYEVAFNLAGTNQYTVWNTDSTGNITTNAIGTVAASSTALEAAETSFHQDLNGDGVIGDPSIPAVVESFGSTTLTQTNGNFFLYAHGTSNGPELKYSGAPWATGQWGGWTPIGAEATASGYDIAFKLTGADQYTVWNADSNGNITTNAIGSVPGNDASLQSMETSFQQDLNNDGVIGPPSHTLPVSASVTAPNSTSAMLAGIAASDGFVFNDHYGHDTTKAVQSGVDQVDMNHTLFANVVELLAHAADHTGSAVGPIAAEASIAFDSVSKLVQQHISNDFHLV